jgi:glutamate synthase (NADPH/NADH) large chain
MVDLEPIVSGEVPPGVGEHPSLEELLADPLHYDAWRLRILIERQARLADSSRAREILADFDHYLGRFVKVVPQEFRRALEEQRRTKVGVA